MIRRKMAGVFVLAALLLVSTSLAYAGNGGPKTKTVPDGKGGERIDVVDRPSNAIPNIVEADRQRAASRLDTQSSMSIAPAGVGGATDYTPPSTITVAIFNNNIPGSQGGQYLRTDTVTFYSSTGTSDYLQNVLPNEWICSAWPMESLKTGAMAVKMYGWHAALAPQFPSFGAAVDNTTDSQKYVPGSSSSNCTTAVRNVHRIGLRRYYGGAPENAYVFMTSYCDGSYADDRSVPCIGSGAGNFITQNGSHYWADPPRSYTYQQILDLYYRPTSPDTQGYFSY